MTGSFALAGVRRKQPVNPTLVFIRSWFVGDGYLGVGCDFYKSVDKPRRRILRSGDPAGGLVISVRYSSYSEPMVVFVRFFIILFFNICYNITLCNSITS